MGNTTQSPPQVQKGDTLANVIRREIADKILAGDLRAGSRLDERGLAEEYGVSRTPIREALKQLVQAGLVSSKPHSGALVLGIAPSRVASLCETSILLETLCARLAALRMSAVELGRLKRAHDECERYHLADDVSCFALANRRFHAAIILGTQNRDLADAVDLCRLRIAPFQRAPFHSSKRRIETQQEHLRIIDALEARDPERAAEAMTEHLSAAALAIDEHLHALLMDDVG